MDSIVNGNIYVETNILRSLPFEIVSASFVKLREISKILRMNICVPRLSIEEYINEIRKKLEEAIAKIDNINAFVSSKIQLSKEKEELLKEAESNFTKNLIAAGVKIIETPIENISTKELIKMSLNDMPPFKSDRGFRDAVIFFSLLAHAKNYLNVAHVFVTNDGDLKNESIVQRAKKDKVDLHIFGSLDEAVDYMKKFIERKLAEYMERRSNNLRGFLTSQKTKIERYIRRNAKFSPYSFSGNLRPLTNVNSIESMRFLNIENAVPEILKNSNKEGWVNISFGVEVELTLLIEAIPMSWPSQMLTIEKEVDAVEPKGLDLTSVLGSTEVQSVSSISKATINKKITLKGEAYVVKKNSEEEYKDLKIKDIFTWSLGEALLVR